MGIFLDCLFLMKHHQHSLPGPETRLCGVPSLSGSGLEFVNEGHSDRIWKEEWSGSHSSQEVTVGGCSSFLAASTSSQFSTAVTGRGDSKHLSELWLFSSPHAPVLSPSGPLLQSFSCCLPDFSLHGIPKSYIKFLILVMLFCFPDWAQNNTVEDIPWPLPDCGVAIIGAVILSWKKKSCPWWNTLEILKN